MEYGWMGTNLEIDLAQGSIEKKEGDAELTGMYLGGKGTNAKILWDRVPPDVNPFSEDNLLIMGTGILTGTIVPGANRTIVTFKSPVTNVHANSAVGGFFGAELKSAGYDTIVFSGKSSAPVYLWIRDDQVEVRDAGHLWGKDTFDTERIIQEELQEDQVQVLCIGPAGENRVYSATIEGNNGVSASRAGAGAVMGDKNLKAIAVRGTKDINIARGPELLALRNQILNRTGPKMELNKNYIGSTTTRLLKRHLWAMDHFAGDVSPDVQHTVKNDLDNMLIDYVRKFKTRVVGCHNCVIACKWVFPKPDGKGFFATKCQVFSAPMIQCQLVDFNFALTFFYRCQKYGLDVISLSNIVAFAIDLYRKGILTKQDTEGMHLEWGNPDVVFTLIDKITHREGIGGILADGVYRAARQIGKGAEN